MVILFLCGTLVIPPEQEVQYTVAKDISGGFSVASDIWNESPISNVAVPGNFDFESTINYDDVGVLINNNSEASRTIGWAFISARNISSDRIFIFDNDSTPTGETINREKFNTYFLDPFRAMLSNHSSIDEINYLVTTKGIPLRISGGNDKASFDQEISLVGGSYDSGIGTDYWVTHGYGPLAGKEMEKFTREEYGFFLVTRLTGYTIDTALELIEKANNSFGARGTHVLDLATNRNDSGYKYWNDDLYIANTTLNATLGIATYFDEETEFVTNISNVIGYASWGSNDGNWAQNILSNGGLDVNDTTWSSGSQYWNATSPSLSSGDEFNWNYQTHTKNAGSGALEASLSTVCTQEPGRNVQGIYAEYFDNNGVSFSTASMPDLMIRVPDHVRLENNLDYSSSSQAYQGLDNRFKNDWGARFSGLIDIPETGNWTFYLTTDDGSELWLDDTSIVQNYGSHGMVERSHSLNVSEGLHDFRIEFFQGGGPHGLQLSWQGPNTSKSIIPASAFYVSGDSTPSQNSLIHKWDFEDGSGDFANDSVANGSNFSLNGMNSSNWKTCVDGGCLWYDGVDDYLQVDVDDWVGNFTISQWVWANTSSQSTYASTFAIDNNAGSNFSFQHAVINGEWKMHNNQGHSFGVVEQQEWAHLVTVFDNGQTRQYLDGVLVRTNSFPNGSFNNIDLYKLGVNRAGNSYFEGMIDNLRIWDTALSNGSVTSLHREIYKDCTAYSGHGQTVASIEQTFTLPSGYDNHPWILSAQGMRTGDVYGEFEIEVESLDVNGTIIATNKSSSEAFTTSWQAATLRYRPPSSTHAFKITIPLDIVSTSTDGSLFLDSVNLQPIRPHNQWVNGSIAETAVSTGGRSFNWDTSYGQSLVADLLEDGVSGVKGYVYEPYLPAVSYPSVLLPSYSSGYNLAESYAAANLQTGWMGVVVGDPKMSAYGDLVHDLDIIDARIIENVSLDVNFTIQIAMQNLGAGEAEGWLTIKSKLGGIMQVNKSLIIPPGNESGSRGIFNFTLNSSKEGWNNFVIQWHSNNISKPEKTIDNNYREIIAWVNSPPLIEDIYCDNSHYSRGDRFICSIEAIDDSGIDHVNLAWRVTDSGNNSTTWSWSATGSQDGHIWWTTIELPKDIPLGALDVMATAVDASNQSHTTVYLAIAMIDDAPALWFGIYVSGVDDSEWGGASTLTSNPGGGVIRGYVTLIKACVLDADHSPTVEAPTFIASRGTIGSLVYQSGSSTNHHCYIANYALPKATSLDYFSLELRDSNLQFITKRNIGISDIIPEIEMAIVDDEGAIVSNLLAGGGENLLVAITDEDDGLEGAYGDLSITWPGQSTQTIPITFENGVSIIPLQTIHGIESGEVMLQVEIIGANGATNSSELSVPIQLTPPEILGIDLCREGMEVDELMFGQTASAVVHVRSTRELNMATATIQQFGWTVIAPQQNATECGPNYADETHTIYFRIQLDSSFVSGEGSLAIYVRDIDELSSNSFIPFEFLHSPPVIKVTAPTNLTAGQNLEVLLEMEDADGIDSSCNFTIQQTGTDLFKRNQTSVSAIGESGFWSANWLLPIKLQGNITASISCVDITNNVVEWSANISVEPLPICVDCETSVTDVGENASSGSSSIIMLISMFLILIILLTIILVRARAREEDGENDDWSTGESGPERDERIPEGWTLDEFIEWINGPVPEEWNEEQWKEYRTQVEDLL